MADEAERGLTERELEILRAVERASDPIMEDLLASTSEEAVDDSEPALPGDDSEARPGLGKAGPVPLSHEHLKSVLESLVFVSDKPVAANRLARVVRSTTREVQAQLGALMEEYRGRGIELVEVAGGYQFRSSMGNAAFVRELIARKPVKLTRSQTETLAIVAYRQPITRPEIDEIRGVDSGSALKALLERHLLKILGRRDEPGRPLLYGTTPAFLEFFGLSTLADLPTLREYSELTEESRELFQRKTGESIDEIADIQVQARQYSDEELEEAGANAEAELNENLDASADDADFDGAGAAPNDAEEGSSAAASSRASSDESEDDESSHEDATASRYESDEDDEDDEDEDDDDWDDEEDEDDEDDDDEDDD